MSSSRVALIERPGGPVRVEERPLPELEPGGALLRVIHSEVCGTDCHLFHGRLDGVPYPLTPGHVSVGELVSIRGECRDLHGLPFREGDVVGFFDVHETCGSCWYCLVAQASTRCPSRRVYGITYGTDEGLLGGWSEYVYLKPGVKLLRLPKELSAKNYIAGGCGMPTAMHAMELAQVKLGDVVAVQGSGPVGLCAVAFAKLSGASEVVLIGAPEARLDLGRRFGADHLIDIRTTVPEERGRAVRKLTHDRGADIVIEACGVAEALVEGMGMTRDSGRYIVVGQYCDHGDVALNPHRLINKKHLEIRGCWGCDYRHFYRGLNSLARSPQVPWEAMISAEYALDEARQALDDVEQTRVVKALINPWKSL